MSIYFVSRQDKQYPDEFQSATIQECYEYIREKKVLGLDTETRKRNPDGGNKDALDPYLGQVALLQIGTIEKQYVIDCLTYSVDELKPILDIIEGDEILKVGHNLKFDYKMLRGSYGIECSYLYDTMIADELIYNGIFNGLAEGEQGWKMYLSSFSLKAVSKRYLGIEGKDDKETARSFIYHRDGKQFSAKQIRYAANDIRIALEVRKKQRDALDNYGLLPLCKMECDLVPVLGSMEYEGIKIDVEALREIVYKYNRLFDDAKAELDSVVLFNMDKYPRLARYKKQVIKLDLFQAADERALDINWKSNVDVLNVFRILGIGEKEFSKQELKLAKVSEKNRKKIELAKEAGLEKHIKLDSKQEPGHLPDTSFKTLAYLVTETTQDERIVYIPNRPEYEIVSKLLKFRECEKVLSTYGEKFIKLVHPITGKIHPSFKQLYPETGRLSCYNPNLQNIKAEGEFRRIFTAEKGNVLITGDYSGQELALIAEGSQEPVWLEAFRNEEDLHSKVATNLFKVEVTKKVNKDLRDKTKIVNFRLAYGGGANEIISQQFIDDYFKAYPLIKKFLDNSGEVAREYGYSLTFAPFNRVRWYKNHADVLKNNDYKALARIERQGKNAPIQGTGADMVKLALVNLYKEFKHYRLAIGNNLTLKLVLTVHDEIVVEVTEEAAEEAKNLQVDTMLKTAAVFVKSIPMTVEAGIAPYWNK